MALEQWALPQLKSLLPLDDGELKQVISYTASLPDKEVEDHLSNLLGDSPDATDFIAGFIKHRSDAPTHQSAAPNGSDPKRQMNTPKDAPADPPAYSPPPALASAPPALAAAPAPWGAPSHDSASIANQHTNPLIKASHRRALDEQQMQQMLQDLQYEYRIYNSDIEPEHETEYYCSCSIHAFQRRKWMRLDVQRMWASAVMYPGEKFYSDNPNSFNIITGNPYTLRITTTPFGSRYQQQYSNGWGLVPPRRPIANCYTRWIQLVISLNNQLNQEAQARINSLEPRQSIWEEPRLEQSLSKLALEEKASSDYPPEKGESATPPAKQHKKLFGAAPKEKTSKMSGFKKAMGIRSAEEKAAQEAGELRSAILQEEAGRWPDGQWRQIVAAYQEKVGMTKKIAELRATCPIQYLHLLRAGYFEPIPVAWATQASNPMKFSIESVTGWRGITPMWRGYEDLAEERLYWVLNHREGSHAVRMKPDFISEMNMAQQRMARAVEPPPLYFSPDDTFRVQHISTAPSKQVMPAPFHAYDRPETASDDTMILLDVSGSMDFNPVRPVYDQYLVSGYANSTQPKNKDVARSVVRRFTDAMSNHDHNSRGYDLVTFSDRAQHIGSINHRNLDQKWRSVRFGGGTRVMTGWQKVKDLHFHKHSQSAVHHPVFGWQAGPATPMLRLLLLLDGEATDMDEFELDLLGLSWAHVTIFLIGVDGCPHHHRHANELQRISDFNHHVSFVDAQGNCPERFVTHELLKRHLGYDVTMQEFEQMEQLPAYTEVA